MDDALFSVAVRYSSVQWYIVRLYGLWRLTKTA